MDINEIGKIKLTGLTINMEYSKSAYNEAGGIVSVNEYIVCDDIPLTINTPNYLIKSSTVSQGNVLSRDCKVIINIAGKDCGQFFLRIPSIVNCVTSESIKMSYLGRKIIKDFPVEFRSNDDNGYLMIQLTQGQAEKIFDSGVIVL